MKRSRPLVLPALLMAVLLPTPSQAQSQPQLSWHGEVRPRIEAREPVAGEWDSFTSMRTRVELDVEMEHGLGLFFQLQDLRTWGGEESARDRSADQIDFHQVFMEIEDLPTVGGMLRGGRQEIGIGRSRLIGAPNWGQGGQSFDGLRWIRAQGTQRLELIALRTKEDSSPIHDENASVLGAWYTLPRWQAGRGQIVLLHDREGGEEATRQTSVGAIWEATLEPISLILQGIHQSGTRGGRDVGASLLSVWATSSLLDGKWSWTLLYDRLSGDDDPGPGRTSAFSTLFGARNRYYGRADYFVDIPGATQELGLQDLGLKLSYAHTSHLTLNVDLHAFRTVDQGMLSDQRLGEEADLSFRYRTRGYMTVEGGYFLTGAASGMEELEILSGTGHYVYFMTSVKF